MSFQQPMPFISFPISIKVKSNPLKFLIDLFIVVPFISSTTFTRLHSAKPSGLLEIPNHGCGSSLSHRSLPPGSHRAHSSSLLNVFFWSNIVLLNTTQHCLPRWVLSLSTPYPLYTYLYRKVIINLPGIERNNIRA